MRKKRVLICDDDIDEYDILERILGKLYEISRSDDCDKVISALESALESNKPIHLLILDLGFNKPGTIGEKEYIAHKKIPEILDKFPKLKIIIRSDIKTRNDLSEEVIKIQQELLGNENIKDFISTADNAKKIESCVDKAIGSPEWLKDGEIWMLHLSDIQFGGEGLPVDNKTLATKVVETINKFVDSEPETYEKGKRKHPFLILITGDITQHGFPNEFNEFSEFAEILSKKLSEMTADFVGILDKNTIFIPGNHDINWNILQAQNLHKVDNQIIYKDGVNGIGSNLEYLKSYSWKPFCEVEFGNPENTNDWIWNPGYKLVDLKEELGVIFVCLNSSRWGHDHIQQHNIVPENIWLDINENLRVIDKDNNTCRILLVHHSIADNVKPENMIKLKKDDDNPKLLRDLISRTCNFAAVFTGHTHEQTASYRDTGSSRERKLVHVGAGTLRSNDTSEYSNPEFNIIKISDLSPDNDKFLSLTVYSFQWYDSHFGHYSTFDYNTKFSEKFDLLY